MRYRSISVFCLGGWPPLLHTGFLVSRTTLDSVLRVLVFAYQALTVFGSLSQEIWLTFPLILSVLNPD